MPLRMYRTHVYFIVRVCRLPFRYLILDSPVKLMVYSNQENSPKKYSNEPVLSGFSFHEVASYALTRQVLFVVARIGKVQATD